MNKKHLEAWNEYIALEKEIEEVLKHIPLTDEHLNVWSLKIGDLLIVLGSVIDSFFKLAIRDRMLDEVKNINNIRRKKQLTILDYKRTFASHYNLISKYVYVRPTGGRIQPFKKWTNKKPPDWWQSYQSVKHNRFDNKEKAKLGYLINSLAGLFLLNVIHLATRLTLCRLKLWNTYNARNYAPGYLESLILVKEPLNQREFEIFYIETNLFGYILEDERNKDTTDEKVWNKVLNVLKEPRY